jgi:hypothetical protein
VNGQPDLTKAVLRGRISSPSAKKSRHFWVAVEPKTGVR